MAQGLSDAERDRLLNKELQVLSEEHLLDTFLALEGEISDARHKRSIALCRKVIAPFLQELGRSESRTDDLQIVFVALGYVGAVMCMCYPRISDGIGDIGAGITSQTIKNMSSDFNQLVEKFKKGEFSV